MKKNVIFLIIVLTVIFLTLKFFELEEPHEVLKLKCLTPEALQKFRASGGSTKEINEICKPEITKILNTRNIQLDDEGIEVIIASLVAYKSAPYGNSTAIKLKTLLEEEQLDCDNYAILMGYLVPKANLHYVGFDGGAVGNHAQVFYSKEKMNLLIDPTIGVFAFISFNELLKGRKIDSNLIFSFYDYSNPDLDIFHTNVLKALQNGEYQPSDLLYYFDNLEHFIYPGNYDRYITPGGRSLRLRRKNLTK